MRHFQILILTLLLIGSNNTLFAQTDTLVINDDIRLIYLHDSVFVHESFYVSKKWGRFPSNGMLVINKGKAILVDTPMEEKLTRDLLNYIENNLKAEVIYFIPGHYHKDNIGGLNIIHQKGIPSYANQMTIDICKERKLKIPQNGFSDSLRIDLEGETVLCKYFGGGHSQDNIVVYLPEQKILFGGCLVKNIRSKNLGNTADAVISEWPGTIRKIKKTWPEIEIIIPGHGACGDKSLLDKTIKLAEQAIN